MGTEEGAPDAVDGAGAGEDLFERWLAHRVQTAEEAEVRPRTFGVTGIGGRDLVRTQHEIHDRAHAAEPADDVGHVTLPVAEVGILHLVEDARQVLVGAL